eukprot:scaffold167799_cov55-Attheya_sp.AAC.3
MGCCLWPPRNIMIRPSPIWCSRWFMGYDKDGNPRRGCQTASFAVGGPRSTACPVDAQVLRIILRVWHFYSRLVGTQQWYIDFRGTKAATSCPRRGNTT